MYLGIVSDDFVLFYFLLENDMALSQVNAAE
jgi:hypothetical protein